MKSEFQDGSSREGRRRSFNGPGRRANHAGPGAGSQPGPSTWSAGARPAFYTRHTRRVSLRRGALGPPHRRAVSGSLPVSPPAPEKRGGTRAEPHRCCREQRASGVGNNLEGGRVEGVERGRRAAMDGPTGSRSIISRQARAAAAPCGTAHASLGNGPSQVPTGYY